MMWKINENGHGIKSFFEGLQNTLVKQVTRMMNDQLAQEVNDWLYREHYERRDSVRRRSQASYQQCGSQEDSQFLRNGYRERQLVTQFGMIDYRLPRVKCVCGGSVRLPFSLVRPYQQIWHDMVAQIHRWADLGLSLRQMQTEISEQLDTQVGLRTLNQVVHDVASPASMTLSSVPPIVMLDAIWPTLLTPTGET